MDTTPRIAHVLDYFGAAGGETGGSFATSILEALGHADAENRATLAAAFPQWGKPFMLAKISPKGTEALQVALRTERESGRRIEWDDVLVVERQLLDGVPASAITRDSIAYQR